MIWLTILFCSKLDQDLNSYKHIATILSALQFNDQQYENLTIIDQQLNIHE